MILRAVKCLNPGEEVYNCYGISLQSVTIYIYEVCIYYGFHWACVLLAIIFILFSGPHYRRMSKGDRKAILQSQYQFTCHCKACQEEQDQIEFSQVFQKYIYLQNFMKYTKIFRFIS